MNRAPRSQSPARFFPVRGSLLVLRRRFLVQEHLDDAFEILVGQIGDPQTARPIDQVVVGIGIDPKGGLRLLVDVEGDGVIDPLLRDEIRTSLARVRGVNADQDQTAVLVLLVEFFELRNRSPTGSSPHTPKIEEDDLALEAGQVDRLSLGGVDPPVDLEGWGRLVLQGVLPGPLRGISLAFEVVLLGQGDPSQGAEEKSGEQGSSHDHTPDGGRDG
jgi:hypothetical protein